MSDMKKVSLRMFSSSHPIRAVSTPPPAEWPEPLQAATPSPCSTSTRSLQLQHWWVSYASHSCVYCSTHESYTESARKYAHLIAGAYH